LKDTTPVTGSGSWKSNKKDGYGVLVFEDGHIYEGNFLNDKPCEPAMLARGRNSDTQQLQLYVDVVDILPSAMVDVNAEIMKLEKLALQYNTELKKLYKQYSSATTDSPVDNTFAMSVKGVSGPAFGPGARVGPGG
jgi:hypothetical protein